MGQGGAYTAIDFPGSTQTLAWSINKAGDTGIGNLSMAALTATSGTISALTATRVTFAGTAGLLSDSLYLTYDPTLATGKLAIGNTINECFARIAAEVPEESLAGVGVAGIDNLNAAFVEKGI